MTAQLLTANRQVEGAEALVLETVDTARFSVVMYEVGVLQHNLRGPAAARHAAETRTKNDLVVKLLHAGGLHPLGKLFGNMVYGRDPEWTQLAVGWL